MSKVKVVYVTGEHYVIKGLIVDCFVDWEMGVCDLVDEEDYTSSQISTEGVMYIEEHTEENILIHKNPQYSLSVNIDIKTAKQRQGEATYKGIGTNEMPHMSYFFLKDVVALYGGNKEKALLVVNSKLNEGRWDNLLETDIEERGCTFIYDVMGYDVLRLRDGRVSLSNHKLMGDDYIKLNKHWLKAWLGI